MKMNIQAILILAVFCLYSPNKLVTKCYKDVCVGQEILIAEGLYKSNLANIYDIIKVKQPDDDAEQIKDIYKYLAYTRDGYIVELYREDIITGK